jgi:capsular exopolysaccharide synthesis family protein
VFRDESRSDPGLLEAMWAYRWSLIAFVLVAALGGYALSSTQEPMYSATARLVLEDPRDPGLLGSDEANRFLDPERYFPQQAQRMENPTVLDAAVASLGTGVTTEQLDRVIDASANIALNTISVTATTPDPQLSTTYANAVADAYQQVAAQEVQEEAARAIEAVQEQIIALRDEADAAEAAAAAQPENAVVASRAEILTERIVALEAQAGDVAAKAAVKDSGVETVLAAEVPEEPSAPLPLRDAAIAGFLAAVVGTLFAYRRAGSNESVTSAGDVAAILGTPLLGEIPRFRRSDRVGSWFSVSRAAGEAFRFVLASIEYQLADMGGASVLLTSASPGEGKSMSALQLSLVACHDGRNAVLVDADVRAHGLTTLLQSEDHPGLTDVLEGSATVDSALRRYRFEEHLVVPVLTAGNLDPDTPWARRNHALPQVVQTLRNRAELVVVDAPPLLAVAETTALGNNVDGIVLVVSSGATRKELLKLSERLQFVTTPVLGFIYNRASDDLTAYGYGYGAQDDKRWFSSLRGDKTPRKAERRSDDVLSGSQARQ